MGHRLSPSGRVMGLSLFAILLAALLVLASPADASRCSYDDSGSGRGGSCPIDDRPDYTPPEDGPSKSEADDGMSPEKIYDEYCSQYHIEYKPEYHVVFWTHILSAWEMEYYNLDPTGTYQSVEAICYRTPGVQNHLTSPPGYFYPLVEGWINVLQEPTDPEVLEGGIREMIEARVEAIPVEPGEMAPPIDAGVVNTTTWLWVDNEWEPVDDEESFGNVVVWAEAEPVRSVYRVEGEVIAECDGPGTPYAGGPLSEGSDCTGEFEKAAVEGREGTVEIVWEFVWGEWHGVNDYFYGPLGDPYTTSTDVTWTVDEVFSTETGDP